jgi:uncharacterized protein YprB with RNaseH-like and TPR domain
MSKLTDRLRGVIGGSLRRPGSADAPSAGAEEPGCAEGTADTQDPPYGSPRSTEQHSRRAQRDAAAEILDGEWRVDGSNRFLVVSRSYAPGHRHGTMSIADGMPPAGGWSRLPLLAGGSCGGGNLLFVDLETTGLAGGAGSYAFLVGCAWFEGARFHVRQFLLASFASERALLEEVGGVARAADVLVTYNGKTFDMPLIETRFSLNRLTTPFAAMPHVDMLHHARRFWHHEDEGHRLCTLEESLLGHEREGDVPGFEIPARYFRYVHTGDPRPLGAVLEHNRLDLLSLALLTARAAHLLDEGAGAASSGSEALGMGRLYERAGLTAEALTCYARAAELGRALRAEALRASAVLLRRLRRHEAAADTWQRLLELPDCPLRFEREAAEALAVHHEHRLRNPLSARGLALRSLDIDATSARREATAHRLARLDRKLARTEVAALF